MAYRKKPVVDSPASYANALARLGELLRDETEARELAAALEAYEASHFPIDAPSPVDAIKLRIEQQGLSYRDLDPIFGGRGKMSEVLNGKRGLSLAMIRALNRKLGIPAAILIGNAQED